MSSCCPSPSLDQTQAVEDRYGAAALAQEACLCTPVAFDPKWLEVIPDEVVERDYGCGDPTRWVVEGDTVLDLGSGSGKNAFICSQVVGAGGAVIGVDRNADMLQLSRGAAAVVADRIGYSNVRFLEGAIEALDAPGEDGAPLIAASSVDVVVSNCVLNLVNPSARTRLLRNIRRVLKPAKHGGTCGALKQSVKCGGGVPCPVDCVAEPWGSWPACSDTCGGGTQTQSN